MNWAVPRTCVGGVPKQAMEKAAPVRGGGALDHVGQSPGTASVRGAIFGAPISVFFGEFHPLWKSVGQDSRHLYLVIYSYCLLYVKTAPTNIPYVYIFPH